jgi:hypothetical protein
METAVAVATSETATGDHELPVAPFPSSPWAPGPQHSTVLPDNTAQAQLLPTEIPVTLVSPETATGVVEQAKESQASGPVVEPTPSSPSELSPQHSAPPPETTAQADSKPTEMAVAATHCPSRQSGVPPEQAVPSVHLPDELHDCGFVLDEHCTAPGLHWTQVPFTHAGVLPEQATVLPHDPPVPHVCAPPSEHWVVLGLHATQPPARHTGVLPEHIDMDCS